MRTRCQGSRKRGKERQQRFPKHDYTFSLAPSLALTPAKPKEFHRTSTLDRHWVLHVECRTIGPPCQMSTRESGGPRKTGNFMFFSGSHPGCNPAHAAPAPAPAPSSWTCQCQQTSISVQGKKSVLRGAKGQLSRTREQWHIPNDTHHSWLGFYRPSSRTNGRVVAGGVRRSQADIDAWVDAQLKPRKAYADSTR